MSHINKPVQKMLSDFHKKNTYSVLFLKPNSCCLWLPVPNSSLIVSKSKTCSAWIKLLKCLSGVVYGSALFIFREKANTLMPSIFHKSVPCYNSKLCVFLLEGTSGCT